MGRTPNRLPNYLKMENITDYQPFADYIIFTEGGKTSSMKTSTGQIIYQGTSAVTVINSTIAACSGGEVIYVEDGTYTLTAFINTASKNNIELWLSKGATFQLGANADCNMIYVNTVSGWWIHGGTFDGKDAIQTTPGGAANSPSYGINIFKSSDTKVSDMTIHDFCRSGIKTEGAAGVYAADTLIENCHIYDCNWSGILPDVTTKGLIIRNCIFHGGGEGGVGGGGTTDMFDILVDGCIAHDVNGTLGPANTNAGIFMEGGTNVKIVNCQVWNCLMGIIITSDGEEENLISNNTVHDCTGAGENSCIIVRSPQTVISNNKLSQADAWNYAIVAGSDADHKASKCVISNNFITGAANTSGIWVARSDTVIVSGNLIDVPGTGILLGTNASDCLITNNLIPRAALGLQIDNANCSLNIVMCNSFKGCTDATTDSGTNTRWSRNVDIAGAVIDATAP